MVSDDIDDEEDMDIDQIIDLLADALVQIQRALGTLEVIGVELTQNIADKLKKLKIKEKN